MYDEIRNRSGDLIGDVDLCQCYTDRAHLVRMVEALIKDACVCPWSSPFPCNDDRDITDEQCRACIIKWADEQASKEVEGE